MGLFLRLEIDLGVHRDLTSLGHSVCLGNEARLILFMFVVIECILMVRSRAESSRRCQLDCVWVRPEYFVYLADAVAQSLLLLAVLVQFLTGWNRVV